MIPTPSPSNDGVRLPHLPGLDGLRGLAVIAVLLFHSEFSWASGGHLGVTTFFVLSGFLITSLLLIEHERTGRVSLLGFWGRRARRLVPAALLAVALAGVYLGYGAERVTKGAFFDGIASLFWMANWRFIVDGQSYDSLFAEPSPFRHFWSLAIEEQFYVVMPLVVVGVVFLSSTKRAARLTLGAVFATVVVASTEWASLLHSPGDAPLRAYYGTDARLAEPALGALLAVVLLSGSQLRTFGPGARRALDGAAIGALFGLVFLMTEASVYDSWLYDGGLLLAAGLAAIVITAVTQDGLVSKLLGGSLLTSLGRISYGVYLFHWPIFLWLGADATGMSGARLLLLRSVVTVSLALVSYAVVEQPVRLGRLMPRIGGLAWANGATAIVAGLALLTGMATRPSATPRSVEVASGFTSGPSSPKVPEETRSQSNRTSDAAAAQAAGPQAAPSDGATSTLPARPSADSGGQRRTSPPPTARPALDPSQPPPYKVAFIGDSVAKNLSGGMKRWGEQNNFIVLDLATEACPISRGGDRRFAPDRPWPIPSGCDWWTDPSTYYWKTLHEFAPDVIVLHDGLNELPDRKLEQWPTWMRPGEPVFNAWLTREYRELIDAVAAEDMALLLMNVPCADWERSEQFGAMSAPESRVTALNTTVYHEIGTSATRVIDLYRYLCRDGYSDTVDGLSNARPDGFHLSDAAAERAAERLLAPAIRDLVDGRRAGGTPSP